MENIKKLITEAINTIKAGGELTPKELATGRINNRSKTIKELERYLKAGKNPITKEEAKKYKVSLKKLESQRRRKLKEWQEYRNQLKKGNQKEKEQHNIKELKN